MIEFIKSLFKPDPAKKIRKTVGQKYKLAVEFQRNGKLREYADVMKEIEDLEEKLCGVKNESK